MKRALIGLVVLLASFGVWMWLADVAVDRSYTLDVLAPIHLLKQPPQDFPQTNEEVGQILPGEAVEVLRMGYGKDFRAWRVKGAKNQQGWFIDDGKNVRVRKKST